MEYFFTRLFTAYTSPIHSATSMPTAHVSSSSKFGIATVLKKRIKVSPTIYWSFILQFFLMCFQSAAPRLRILVLADLHIDLHYTVGGNANCKRPACCSAADGVPCRSSASAYCALDTRTSYISVRWAAAQSHEFMPVTLLRTFALQTFDHEIWIYSYSVNTFW